ncbi:MAG TPA: two-component regulator propeller domain-containing protein [Puia sp.]|nr:two-component regulator propeller domain-containing protein [Puia sp.]
MTKYKYALFLMIAFCTSCGQNQTEGKKIIINSENRGVITSHGPKWITRNIIQDRKGNIWIAAFDGIFRYDGKSFTNITSKVSPARFFSVLEDKKGNLWFGSIGSGVYCYDGISFTNFTTGDGLPDNRVGCIYEDKAGNIWFGTENGASRYDGKSFRNYRLNGGVNAIIEDKTGKFWFATTGNTFIYDGKAFTVFTHAGKPFKNVRSIIEDKKGNTWLGGSDGLWRYDGRTFTNFTQKSVSDIIEDKKGNIWTSSESADSPAWVGSETGNIQAWALTRYDGKSLSDKKPTVTEVTNKGMIFGILEDDKGSIWFGAFDGVHRYDGKTFTDFKSKEGQQ